MPGNVRPRTSLGGLFHVSDYLPTLFAAVGGDTATLQSDIDGINQWQALLAAASKIGARSARTELYVAHARSRRTAGFVRSLSCT